MKSSGAPAVPRVRAGLLAARPAAAATGRVYYGTDTRVLYHDAPGGWVAVARAPIAMASEALVAGAFAPLRVLTADPATAPPVGAGGVLIKSDGLYLMTAAGAVGRLATLSASVGGTAPAAPTGVAAVASGLAITVSWVTPSGFPTLTVKRSTAPGGPYTVVVAGLPPTQTSYVDSGLAAGQYYYVVAATSGGLTSPDSAEVTATATAASAYAAAVLADGPLVYLRLNDAPGSTTAADSAPGGAHPGAVHTNPGGSAVFGGVGVPGGGAVTLTPPAWIEVADFAGLDPDARKPVTYECVFAVATGIGAYARLLAKEALTNATGQHNGSGVQITPSLQPQFTRLADPIGQNSFVNGPTGVVADTKHHGAFVYDGTTMIVYIDGVAVASSASTFNITDNVAPFVIGAGWDLSFGPFLFFKGLVAEVAIYAKALTASRVLAHSQAANL